MYTGILSAKANDEDTPTWHHATNGPQKKGYWKARITDIWTLTEKMHSGDITNHESWMNILSSACAFGCKQYPDVMIKKLREILRARGDRQLEGVYYFKTYVPVVNWQTVRNMLILSILLDLQTIQVDYTAAFLHSNIYQDPNWESIYEAEI
jgi:hypothetical protein